MVHFELTDVIRTVKYCNFPSYIMKLQYLKCILTRFFFSKIDAEKTQFSYENYQSGTQWDHASKKLLPQKGHVSKMSCLKKVIVANGSSLNNVIVTSQKGCCCKLFISQNGYVSKGLFCKVIMSQKGHSSKEVIPHNDSWLLGAPEVERFFSQIRLCSCKKTMSLNGHLS